MMRLRFKPWLIAAAIWGVLSLVIISEYLKGGETRHLIPIWFLLSLLWAEFGAAALFNALLKRKIDQLCPLSLITLLPPLILFFIIQLMVRYF